MNQYIITEERLRTILERRGSNYLSCQGKFRDEIVAEVRSNPYNPQADTIPRMNKEYIEERNRLIRQDAMEKVLEKIANMVLSCVWSDAPDCPGVEDGECICDGCPQFKYMGMEDFREYIREELRKKDGEP